MLVRHSVHVLACYVLKVGSVHLLRVGKDELTNVFVNMLQRKVVSTVAHDVRLSQLSDVVFTDNSLNTIIKLHFCGPIRAGFNRSAQGYVERGLFPLRFRYVPFVLL